MCQKTEKKLSGVHLGKNCKTMYYRIFFFWSFGSFNSNFSGFLSLFSINCCSLLCTLGHLFFTTVSFLLNYAREKFPISADLQSRVLLDFSSIFFITFCQSIIYFSQAKSLNSYVSTDHRLYPHPLSTSFPKELNR